MNNDDRKESIKFDDHDTKCTCIIYNLKDQLILYNETTIWTYTSHNKCEISRLSEDYKLIGVSRNGKRYLSLDNYIYEWSDAKIPAKRIYADQNSNVIIYRYYFILFYLIYSDFNKSIHHLFLVFRRHSKYSY